MRTFILQWVVVGLVPGWFMLRFFLRVHFGLGLQAGLATIARDRFRRSSSLGPYADSLVPPVAHLIGESSEIYYWLTLHEGRMSKESLRINVKGFLGGIDIYFTNGQPVRMTGPRVLFDRLQDGDEAFNSRVMALLRNVRSKVSNDIDPSASFRLN